MFFTKTVKNKKTGCLYPINGYKKPYTVTNYKTILLIE